MSTSTSWIDKLIGRDVQHSPDDPCAEGMPDCEEVHDNASDFIDGEVSPRLTTRIRHHLGLCSDCDPWFTSLAQTVGLIRQVPQEKVPDSLKDKIGKFADGQSATAWLDSKRRANIWQRRFFVHAVRV